MTLGAVFESSIFVLSAVSDIGSQQCKQINDLSFESGILEGIQMAVAQDYPEWGKRGVLK